jgi:hypothetical protein
LRRERSCDDPFANCGIAQTYWQEPAQSPTNKANPVPWSRRKEIGVELCQNQENKPFVNELMLCGSKTDGQRDKTRRTGRRPRPRSAPNSRQPSRKSLNSPNRSVGEKWPKLFIDLRRQSQRLPSRYHGSAELLRERRFVVAASISLKPIVALVRIAACSCSWLRRATG